MAQISARIDKGSKRTTLQRLARRGVVGMRIAARMVAASSRRVRDDARANAPRDRGEMARTIRVHLFGDGLNASVRVQKHGPYQEFGTGTRTVIPAEARGRYSEGSSSPHFPPPSALVGWVQRKLGVPADQADSVAFLVARSIFRRGGLRPKPFLFPALRRERPRFRAAAREALLELTR